MAIEFQEHSFDAGVVTINYATGPPSGPPLVLLHGGSARWQDWRPAMRYLAPRWHVYAPDLRGHGLSGRVPGRYRLQDYADDTIAFLQQRIGEPVRLFGGSLGGEVALLVAAQCPDYVRAVVVGDSPLDIETMRDQFRDRDRVAAWRDLAGDRLSIDEIAEALKDTLTEVPDQPGLVTMREKWGEDSPVFAALATRLYYNDPDMLTALLDDFETTMEGYEMESLLPTIHCPVLLLQADPKAGGLMTDAEVERALPLLAHPQHAMLKGTSHILFTDEHKELVLRTIEAFLEST
jgi:pimeloyl-ACP methyl ester carboxylesterase